MQWYVVVGVGLAVSMGGMAILDGIDFGSDTAAYLIPYIWLALCLLFIMTQLRRRIEWTQERRKGFLTATLTFGVFSVLTAFIAGALPRGWFASLFTQLFNYGIPLVLYANCCRYLFDLRWVIAIIAPLGLNLVGMLSAAQVGALALKGVMTACPAVGLLIFIASLHRRIVWSKPKILKTGLAVAAFSLETIIAVMLEPAGFLFVIFSVICPLALYALCYMFLYGSWTNLFVQLIRPVAGFIVGFVMEFFERTPSEPSSFWLEELLKMETPPETTRRYGHADYDIRTDSQGNKYIDTPDGIRYLIDGMADHYYDVDRNEVDRYGHRI